MNRSRKVAGRRPHVVGTFDVTSFLRVGGVQVRADRNFVEVRLANGTEISIETGRDGQAGFLVHPAAAERVEIRPDDVPAESPPAPACEGEVPAEPGQSPVVRTGPGGDFCRDWPEKKVRGERLEVRKTAAPGGSRSHLSPLTCSPGEGA